MASKLPKETIKPAYPLGDENVDVAVPQQGTDKTATPKQPAPKKIDEPQTDGE